MDSTKLSTILNRMDRYQDVATVEEQYKVRDIDEAIRTLRRNMNPPWVQKQTTIALFRDISTYPVASDHGAIALIGENAKFKFTSLEQFKEDEGNRNKMAEIWDGGDRYLGIKYKTLEGSTKVSSNDSTDWTASGTASSPAEETVEISDGENTVKFTVTSGTATMTEAAPSNSFTDYKKKYYFRNIFLATVPTSITLRYGNDSSNYLEKTGITTQFSGQAFKANSWNIVAMNLDTATETGTLVSTAFDYSLVSIVGAGAGTYYMGPAYIRTRNVFDYNYYSSFNIKSSSSSVLDKEFFFNDTTNAYSLDDALVGDPEWIDVITFDAILTTLADNKNKDVIASIADKRERAWKAFASSYPDMQPVVITQNQNFGNDPSSDWL